MTVAYRLEELIDFFGCALHLHLHTPVDQIRHPAHNIEASREMPDSETKTHALNSAFIENTSADHFL
jgi:hypothetical protein